MANWLSDYIEMTEYIPSELREQLTSIRELDLQVHNAMDELERDIKQFFSRITTLSAEERQDQYDEFLTKCDLATKAASDKVRVADKLHDLVEKSMRLLDQGLEKLKDELLEGDKAYVVEDLERRSQELDEQLKLEQETMLQKEHKTAQSKASSKHNNVNGKSKSNSLNVNNQSNHRQPAHPHKNHLNNHHNHQLNHRSRHNSTGTPSSVNRQKKRERKRLNSTMTIFNRTSMTDQDSTSQSFLPVALNPDCLLGMKNSLNGAHPLEDQSGLLMRGMVAGTKGTSFGISDKSNRNDPLARARPPILSAIDAAHAVSPNATNSDKLGLFSNANGDSFGATKDKQISLNTLSKTTNNNNIQYHQQNQQVSGHLLPATGYNSGNSTIINSSTAIASRGDRQKGASFSSLPLSSHHDPIMMAASQAISATQNMTFGRRTSSLKASYAAVNSGRLQASPSNKQVFEQTSLTGEIYCKCRGTIHDPNMIACDNKNCEIEWFHYECVGITTPPEGEWFCEECKQMLGLKTKSTSQHVNPSGQQPQAQAQSHHKQSV